MTPARVARARPSSAGHTQWGESPNAEQPQPSPEAGLTELRKKYRCQEPQYQSNELLKAAVAMGLHIPMLQASPELQQGLTTLQPQAATTVAQQRPGVAVRLIGLLEAAGLSPAIQALVAAADARLGQYRDNLQTLRADQDGLLEEQRVTAVDLVRTAGGEQAQVPNQQQQVQQLLPARVAELQATLAGLGQQIIRQDYLLLRAAADQLRGLLSELEHAGLQGFGQLQLLGDAVQAAVACAARLQEVLPDAVPWEHWGQYHHMLQGAGRVQLRLDMRCRVLQVLLTLVPINTASWAAGQMVGTLTASHSYPSSLLVS